MTSAEQASANAIHSEMVLHAFRRTNTGTVVSFVLHPEEVPADLAIAPLGSRYVVALVRVGDDELPVKQTRKEAMPNNPDAVPGQHAARPEPNQPPARAKRDWREIPTPQQAGIRCDDPIFAAFLKEQRPDDWHERPDAVDCVYLICGISSRSELATNSKARLMWNLLDSAYDAWKAKERVGA